MSRNISPLFMYTSLEAHKSPTNMRMHTFYLPLLNWLSDNQISNFSFSYAYIYSTFSLFADVILLLRFKQPTRHHLTFIKLYLISNHSLLRYLKLSIAHVCWLLYCKFWKAIFIQTYICFHCNVQFKFILLISETDLTYQS